MINSKASIRVNYGDDAKNERSEKIELKFIWTGNFESTGGVRERSGMLLRWEMCKTGSVNWITSDDDESLKASWIIAHFLVIYLTQKTEARRLIHAADTEPGSSLLEIE